jgi:RimJ/RimL family protein N-acetyltransferase
MTSRTGPRVEVRHVVEADRSRFMELFCDNDFMVYAGGALSPADAGSRFDAMLARCAEVSFAKQPIVELSTGDIVGYTGVDRIEIDGRLWLEWGYRLVPSARGKGYATEAGKALMARAAAEYSGELLAIIAPDNLASQNVCRKLGFEYWKLSEVDGEPRNLYTLRLG